ncbi:MAG: T9SS type A sorting domain-containing protein, partial [Bacteroidota bacterium]
VCGIDYTASYRFYFDPVTGNYPDTGNPFPSFVDFYAPYNFRDVTGDGKKDILGLSSGQLIYVDATDTTTVHNLAFIPGAYADFFRLTDWDHDGDLDLFTVTYDELAWFENEGDDFAGPYRKHELGDLDRGLPPGHRGGLSLGLDVQESGGKIDWDGDGDEDLFFRFFAFLPNLERDGSFEIGTYYDENENGRRDTSENWLVNTPITLTPPPVALRRFQSGSYLGFSAAEETHTVLVQPPTDWELVSDPPTVTVGQTGSPPAKYAIAVAPTSNDRKFGVEMTAGILRCNTVVPYWVNVTNLHATANPLTYLEVELEEGLSFANPPDSVVGNVGYFPVAPIKALQRKRLLIEVQAPGPEQIGGQLSVTARFPYRNGTQETVATTSLCSELRCSYDPNDKLVFPPGEKETSRLDYGTTLEYTIRFQNTGNDTAFLVTLLDTLDADLDYTSLRVRSASHPMTTDVDLERGIATFLFEDIELLAQTEDDARSQGYVKFTIDHLPDLREHTDVHNRAAIYFDRNPPIITNDTYRQIRPGGDTSTTTREHFLPETAWKMYPNPATDFLRVEIEPTFFGDALMIDLLNVKGEVLRRYRGRLSNTLALPELPSGTYFLRLRNKGRVLGVRKLSLQR